MHRIAIVPMGPYAKNELHWASVSKVMKTCPCYHSNQDFIATRLPSIAIVLRDPYAKNELQWASASKIMKTCLCCYGNKSSIATIYVEDCNCPKGSLCHKSTSLGFS